MKIKIKAILFMIFIQLSCLISNAQEMRVFKGKPGEILMLPEIGAIIQLKDNKIVVENVMPVDMRDKDYKNVDLQEADIIMMVNGKKVKTVKDCQDVYDKLKVGEEFKMGITRNDKMFIAGFKKADPSKLKGSGMRVVKMDGKDGDVRVLPEFGIVLSGSKGKVTVKEVIKDIPDAKRKDVKSGDLILKVNDKEVENLSELDHEYEKIKGGKKIELVLLRKDKEIVVTAEKNDGEAKVIIKKSK